jgi:carboxypeptidase C (cathepsin A)
MTGARNLSVLLMLALAASAFAKAGAQEKESKPAEKAAEVPPGPPPKEDSSVTDHTIKIGGQTIPYKATTATILIKNEKDEPTALIYSTAYTRSDVKDMSQRPISFLYNGGPGSSSVWLHMGSVGPRRVMTINAGVTPPAPYKLMDNPDCLLDKSDLVFVDPVGTGFSHAVGKAQDKDFWGVDSDVKSLAQFIATYISRNNRWNSPKFLIGESYGTFRNAALANYLQNHDNLYLNGIVMVSWVLDLGTISFYPGQDLAYILYLPSYAATAWFHKTLKDRPDNLNAFLDEARKFARGEYAGALMKGDELSKAEKAEIAKKVARFTGLSEDYLEKANLRVRLFQFMQELQRNRGLTTGRLDARFAGPTYNLIGEAADYDPQETAISGAFVGAFNTYIREELKFGQEKGLQALRRLWAESLGLETRRERF